MIIRPVKTEDSKFINEIRRMDGVRENITGIISERTSRSEVYIASLSENDHFLVAEVEEDGIKKVVGNICLTVMKNPRKKHCGSVGIMVDKDYQSKGIGRALFNEILDLADNWLMLVRIELDVISDNEKAIALYKSLGFEIEGKKKYGIIKYGKYVDEYIMARYHLTDVNA